MKTANRNSFTVGVKLLSAKSFSVMVTPTDTVAALKQRIFEREGIPPQRQNLLVDGKQLQPDTRALNEYHLKPGDMVYVTQGVRGYDPPSSSAAAGADKVDPNKSSSVARADWREAQKGLQKTLSDITVEMKLPAPTDNLAKARAESLSKLMQITTVVRHKGAQPQTENNPWSRASEAYCWGKRTSAQGKSLTVLATHGLSNAYQNTFYFATGIALEIALETLTEDALLDEKHTAVSLSENWMFAIVHELAHQCFPLGLQIRQLIDKLTLVSVEIAGINLPAKYLDPDSGRCCVLLSYLPNALPQFDDPTLLNKQSFTVSVSPSVLSVLYVKARLLTFEQCLMIRNDGADARKKLVAQFAKDKSYGVSSLPAAEWRAPAPAPAPAPTAGNLEQLQKNIQQYKAILAQRSGGQKDREDFDSNVGLIEEATRGLASLLLGDIRYVDELLSRVLLVWSGISGTSEGYPSYLDTTLSTSAKKPSYEFVYALDEISVCDREKVKDELKAAGISFGEVDNLTVLSSNGSLKTWRIVISVEDVCRILIPCFERDIDSISSNGTALWDFYKRKVMGMQPEEKTAYLRKFYSKARSYRSEIKDNPISDYNYLEFYAFIKSLEFNAQDIWGIPYLTGEADIFERPLLLLLGIQNVSGSYPKKCEIGFSKTIRGGIELCYTGLNPDDAKHAFERLGEIIPGVQMKSQGDKSILTFNINDAHILRPMLRQVYLMMDGREPEVPQFKIGDKTFDLAALGATFNKQAMADLIRSFEKQITYVENAEGKGMTKDSKNHTHDSFKVTPGYVSRTAPPPTLTLFAPLLLPVVESAAVVPMPFYPSLAKK